MLLIRDYKLPHKSFIIWIIKWTFNESNLYKKH